MTFKVVKSAKAQARLADRWFELRAERLALQKKVEKLELKEREAKRALIDSMQKYEVATIGGSAVSVSHVEKIKPIATDWNAVFTHIMDTEEFDLLQKRLSDSAVKARWEEGEEVPGVEELLVHDLSYTTRKP